MRIRVNRNNSDLQKMHNRPLPKERPVVIASDPVCGVIRLVYWTDTRTFVVCEMVPLVAVTITL
jgi:hypothetical protein